MSNETCLTKATYSARVRGGGPVSGLFYGVTPLITMLFLLVCVIIVYPPLVS